MVRHLAVLFFSLLALIPHSEAGLHRNVTILLLGDSLSAGYGMEQEQAWPSLLQQQWKKEGRSWTLINASISGDTTQGGLNRLPQLLRDFEPDWILIELGANDGLRGLPLEEMQDNLGQMILLSQQAGTRVILSEVMLPPNYGERYSEMFNTVYQHLTLKYQVPLMPFFMIRVAGDPNLMQADGIHPNEKAQPLLQGHIDHLLQAIIERELSTK